MTDVEIAYSQLRLVEGRGHAAAIKLVARRYGLTEDDVAHALRRAEADQRRRPKTA